MINPHRSDDPTVSAVSAQIGELRHAATKSGLYAIVHGVIAVGAGAHVAMAIVNGEPANWFVTAIALLTGWWCLVDWTHCRRLVATAAAASALNMSDEDLASHISFALSTAD